MLNILKTAGIYAKRIRINKNTNSYIYDNNYQIKSSILFMLPRYMMSGEAAVAEGRRNECVKCEGMSLQDIVQVLTDYAPLSLAESWDNVGLLIEPFMKRDVKRIMLTNDLAESVMKECLEKDTDMIISYHPPIFTPIKKFALKTWTEKVIHCCLENKIAVYSPHTTWDSVPGGISDWLASAFDVTSSDPLQAYYTYNPPDHIYSIIVNYESALYKEYSTDDGRYPYTDNLGETLSEFGVKQSSYISDIGNNMREFVGSCKKDVLPVVFSYLTEKNISFEVYNRAPLPVPNTGIGRFCKLKVPITIKEAVQRIKQHTEVKLCRVAYGVNSNPDTLVSTAAVVPGSGGKVLANVKADLYITGEMLHHDVLAAIHNNSTVIMTTHSDSERGFLKVFANVLREKLDNKVEVLISSKDKDAIQLV